MTETNIQVTAGHDGSLTREQVRDALRGMDVSVTSPISADGSEVGIRVGDDSVTLVVAGFDAEFTKTSQRAVTRSLGGLSAVDETSVEVEGGYSADEE